MLFTEIQIATTSLFVFFSLLFLSLARSLSVTMAVLSWWTYLWSCVSVRERQADTVRNYYLRKILLDCCGWTGLSKGHAPASDWNDIRWVTYQSESLLFFSPFFFFTPPSRPWQRTIWLSCLQAKLSSPSPCWWLYIISQQNITSCTWQKYGRCYLLCSRSKEQQFGRKGRERQV